MDCAQTLSDKTESLSFEQTVEFLEPTDTRGAAVCMSASDFNRIKTTLEKACEKLGRACTREAKASLQAVSSRIDQLQARVASKPRRPK